MAGPHYSVVSQTVEPITELLKALVQLNYLAVEANEAGWTVDFSINPDTLAVDVHVRRDGWPEPQAELPA